MKHKQDLTQEKLKELLSYDPDSGLFTRKKKGRGARCMVGDVAGTVGSKGYVSIKVLNYRYQAHRLAWIYVYGVWPEDQVDHINGIKHDNRISNLRGVTNSQNQMNTGLMKSNKSGFKGVYFKKDRNKWQAKITVNKKHIFLGYFDDAESAAKVYQEASDKHHGEFANY